MAAPRWREDPTPLVQSLQSYLRIDDPKQAPNVVFQRGEAAAEQAIDQLVAALQKTSHGRVSAKFGVFRCQPSTGTGGLAGSTEILHHPYYGYCPRRFLRSGEELARSGILQNPTDSFYLHLDEMKALGEGEQRDWQALIAERQALYRRELRRQPNPRACC